MGRASAAPAAGSAGTRAAPKTPPSPLPSAVQSHITLQERQFTQRIVCRWGVVPENYLYMGALPIAAEIDARLVPHRQRHHSVDLNAIRVAPVILAPRALLRKTREVRAG